MTKFVPVAAFRSRVESVGGGIEVTMPSRRNYVFAALQVVWLGFWVYALVAIVPPMFHETVRNPPPMAFMWIWIVGWVAGGCFIFALFLWTIAGLERVTVTPDGVLLRREAAGVGLTRHFDVKSVRALRVVDNVDNNVSFGGFGRGDPFGLRSGSLAFDYGAKTIRFGSGVDAAEAKYIISKIVAARPALAEQA